MLLKLSATVSLAYKSRWDRLRTFRLSIRSYALALLFCNRRKKTFGGQLLSEFSGIRTRDTCRPVKESRLVPLSLSPSSETRKKPARKKWPRARSWGREELFRVLCAPRILQFLAFSLGSMMSLPRWAFYVVSALHHCFEVQWHSAITKTPL